MGVTSRWRWWVLPPRPQCLLRNSFIVVVGKPIGLILIILLFVWLASGLYRVLPDEQGVVLRFGKFVKTTQPGLNYHIPFPVEGVETPKVTKVNRMDIGFRSERESRKIDSYDAGYNFS